MTFFSKTGSFTCRATTGNDVITGLGFQPKLVLFFATYASGASDAPTSGTSAIQMGVAISSSSRRAVGSRISSNQGLQHDARILDWAGGATEAIDFVSMDADGFTISVTSAAGTGDLDITYIALGGTDLTNVALGTWALPTATGNQAVTGVGFQPDAIMLFSGMLSTSLTSNFSGAGTNTSLSIGYAKSTTERVAMGCRRSSDSTQWHYQRTDQAYVQVGAGGALIREADLVSLDADGFTLNFSTCEATTRNAFYLAIKGPSIEVGSLLQPNFTPVTQTITDPNFRAKAVLFAGVGEVASATIDVNYHAQVGAIDNVGGSVCAWSAGIGVNRFQMHHRSKAIHGYDLAGATQRALAGGNPPPTNGFELYWSTLNGDQRETLYMALGPTSPEADDFAVKLAEQGLRRSEEMVGY